ncbi:ComEC/Rec2 family competence protein [bacterium]|nr:ComEC/Rec2 family competence protein [bacterium]
MCEIIYRPLFLLLSVVVWAIVGSVCYKLAPSVIIFLALLQIIFYYLLLRWQKIRPSLYRFSLLILLTLAAAWFGAQKIALRQANFLTAQALLAESGPKTESVLGRITALPRGFHGGWYLRLQPLGGRLSGYGEVLLKLPATVYDDPRLPLVGDVVAVQGQLRSLKAARHPFLRGRLRTQRLSGIVAQCEIAGFADIEIVARFSGGLALIEKVRRSLYRALSISGGSSDSAAILQAVLIGSRDQLSPKTKELFLDFGVFHLFAISGLHLSVVVSLFFFLVKSIIPNCLRQRLVSGTTPIAAGITILFLPGYLFLAGLHLPVVRAGIMAFCFLLALLSGRLRDPFSALLGAAVVILMIWPEALFALSFQLSFTAVATILWVVPRAKKWWLMWLPAQKIRPGLQVFFVNCFCLGASSLAISLATAPFLINRVHFISLYSLFANMLLIPLFSLLIIPLGMLSLMFAKLPGIMALMLKPLVIILEGLVAGGVWLLSWLPGGRTYFASLSSPEVVLGVLIMLTIAWLLTPASSKKITGCFLFLLLALLTLDLAWWQNQREKKQVSVAAFVGGRPQVLLFELPGGEALLFNGGSWCGPSGSAESLDSTDFFSFARNVIAPYCWRRKLKQIDTLVLTEPQRGLVGGLLFLVEHFKVREIWYHGIWSGYPPFKNFCSITKDRFGVRWQKLSSFSCPFSLNGVEVEVVGPPANDFEFSTSSSLSLQGMAPSLLLRYGEFSALIWGGGQVDPSVLPEQVDLLALLRPCGSTLPQALADVSIEPGGWFLQPSTGRQSPPQYLEAKTWAVKRDGFFFLKADISGKLTNKLPASLISSCQ